MFHNHLANEEARHEIERRAREAEIYSLHKRLGYGDSRAARWVLVFIVLLAVVAALGLL